nr:immunoglobulin light chain junction region [Macaca mulatta]
CQQGYTHPYSF